MVLVKAGLLSLSLLCAVTLSACANATEPKQEPESDDKPVEVSAVPVMPETPKFPGALEELIPEKPKLPEVVTPKAPVTIPEEVARTPKPPVVDQCKDQPDKVGCNDRVDPPEDTPLKPVDDTPEAPQTKKVDLTVKFDPPVTITNPTPVLIVPKQDEDDIEEWIRAILIPVILWLMSMLALYNVRRHRLIESLKVDMVNQLKSQFEWLGQIERWLENHDTLDRLPIYSNVSDAVFKESLGDIKRYLWDKELDRVHMFYDCIGEVQKTLEAGLSFHNKMKNSSEPSAVSLVDFQSDLKLRSSEDLWEKICEAYSASLLLLFRLAAPIIGEKKPKLIREISPKLANPQFDLLIDSFFVREWIWRLFYLWIPLFSLILAVYVTYLQFNTLTLLSVASLATFVAGVAYMLDRVVRNIWPEYKITEQEKPSVKEGS